MNDYLRYFELFLWKFVLINEQKVLSTFRLMVSLNLNEILLEILIIFILSTNPCFNLSFPLGYKTYLGKLYMYVKVLLKK